MALLHTWKCDCGAFLKAVGPNMLLTDIEDHDWVQHGRKPRMLIDEMTASPRYVAAEAAVFHEVLRETNVYGQLTKEDIDFLLAGRVRWMGDTRLPVELSKRYKPRSSDYSFD